MRNAHVAMTDGPIGSLQLEEDAVCYSIGDRVFRTQALYVAMGCEQRISLAAVVGTRDFDEGYVIVDAHQRTSVKGLYAVGDVVAGLDQIVTAPSVRRAETVQRHRSLHSVHHTTLNPLARPKLNSIWSE